ncbi:hypothetical protein CAC42_974 [Sphaceloma murrayae]|uniref:Uncharacterized protein n=1 Tax=Sphaceloma murrayae TaxID=2082308 RepID=A0A2K1R2V1_9PEZI|nr:hypothetical protein CAC42_974 [Sphaceloma murrayae]
MPIWQRSHRKNSASQGQYAGHGVGSLSLASGGMQSDSDSVYSTNSASISRSRSNKLNDQPPPSPSKFRRALHRPGTPSSSSIPETSESVSLCDRKSRLDKSWLLGPARYRSSQPIAETPAGQLISQAIDRGQATHQARPASPPKPSASILTNSDTHPANDDEVLNTPMSVSSIAYQPSKSSSDSGQSVALDRWSQRRLQRLNTEQGFREQRQGGPPVSVSGHSQNISDAGQQNLVPTQPQQPQSQLQQAQYQSQASRTPPNTNGVGLNQISPPPPPPPNDQNQARPPAFAPQYQNDPAVGQSVHVPSQQQQSYSPESLGQYQSHSRPTTLQQARSFSQSAPDDPGSMMSVSTNAPLPAPKPVRSNRQSMHNGVNSASPGAHQPLPPQPQQLQAPAPPQHSSERIAAGNIGRATPQPSQSGEDMSTDEVNQLLKDHKELREKYTKVKKYYFEKEEQVKQLQNVLAHQRLAQSRTSLDDSEYSTRLNRLDGLIAQLAFSIRKSWKAVPLWLASSVNKDAIQTGKQEMTAAGRAFISCWLVDEVFEKYFHPDLDPALSRQLKNVQKNIRRFSPQSQTIEEEEHLCAKIANWRLSTLDGLQDVLRSSHNTNYRTQLMDILKAQLIDALQVHLSDPPMSDLEGGVSMIIELAVSMATHIPLESRDVIIEYYMPGNPLNDMMKQESGIPTLGTSVAEDADDRMSLKSTAESEEAGQSYHDGVASGTEGRREKRSMLSALTGKKSHSVSGKNPGAASSSGSLHRPESAGKDDSVPRVRMSVGLAAMIRGKNVLVKAPVFSTV